MWSSIDRRQKILIISFFVVILLVPIASLLISARNSASPQQTTLGPRLSNLTGLNEPTEVPKTTALEELKNLAQAAPSAQPSVSPSPDPALTSATSFGPTLTFKLITQGHPANNQATQVFVGLAAGNVTNQPTYLLSFTVDVPASGLFEGLSLAGLESGTTYTAYIKGSSTLATASAFYMAPGVSNLNNGSPLTLLAGDLNEDNIVNSADYSIAKGLYGTTQSSANWNPRADLNIDGVINTLDLGYIAANYGKTGMSGAWFSPPPATSSGGLQGGVGGYWIWIPR